MGNNQLIILLILGVSVTFGCSKSLDFEDYQRFVTDPDNGLRKNQLTKDFELSVLYEPTDYILAQEPSVGNTDNRKKDLDQYEHFQFRIKLRKGGNILNYKSNSLSDHSDRINHFSFNAQNDFMLVSGMDTAHCAIAHFSRNYNLMPTIDLSLVFQKAEKKSDWQLIYTDQQFNLGRIKFLFHKADLTSLPILKS